MVLLNSALDLCCYLHLFGVVWMKNAHSFSSSVAGRLTFSCSWNIPYEPKIILHLLWIFGERTTPLRMWLTSDCRQYWKMPLQTLLWGLEVVGYPPVYFKLFSVCFSPPPPSWSFAINMIGFLLIPRDAFHYIFMLCVATRCMKSSVWDCQGSVAICCYVYETETREAVVECTLPNIFVNISAKKCLTSIAKILDMLNTVKSSEHWLPMCLLTMALWQMIHCWNHVDYCTVF